MTIRDGRIDDVLDADQVLERSPLAPDVEDLGQSVLMPGLVDSHVHINEPGRGDWEGFETATEAAAAGGVTTVIDMPLNCIPPTTSAGAFQRKCESARERCFVDVGFHGGLVPTNARRMDELVQSGVLGVKTFLCPSGVEEFPRSGRAELCAAMPELARAGMPLLVHAELLDAPRRLADPRSYRDYLASRPVGCEVRAIELMTELCRRTGCRVHIVHLSSAEGLARIAEARSEGLPLSVETCPHYLLFAAEGIGDGQTLFKSAPPIRGGEDREQLWTALMDGAIDLIATDHSPCPREMKALDSGNFEAAWGGISSLGLALSVVWTAGRERGVSLSQLTEWLSASPARLVGLGGRKGAIAPGLDADLVVWDPSARRVIRAEDLRFRHEHSPYEGVELRGVVERTYLRGRLIFRDGLLLGEPAGEILRRGGGRTP